MRRGIPPAFGTWGEPAPKAEREIYEVLDAVRRRPGGPPKEHGVGGAPSTTLHAGGEMMNAGDERRIELAGK